MQCLALAEHGVLGQQASGAWHSRFELGGLALSLACSPNTVHSIL